MSDRIHDSESNADKRELAALRQGIADMKASLLKHAAAGARLDKVMLAICLSIAAIAIAGFMVLTFCPAAPHVTITNCVQPVEGATRQRDRDALGVSTIRRVLNDRRCIVRVDEAGNEILTRVFDTGWELDRSEP
jgi:hypothetical protein